MHKNTQWWTYILPGESLNKHSDSKHKVWLTKQELSQIHQTYVWMKSCIVSNQVPLFWKPSQGNIGWWKMFLELPMEYRSLHHPVPCLWKSFRQLIQDKIEWWPQSCSWVERTRWRKRIIGKLLNRIKESTINDVSLSRVQYNHSINDIIKQAWSDKAFERFEMIWFG